MHAFALTVSLLTFLTVYTVNKAKEAIIKLHYYSDILTKLLEQNKVCQRLLKHPNTQKLYQYLYQLS
jgi:mannitol/fructose-specific phosphotransferase system IIA component (Ntr-type)